MKHCIVNHQDIEVINRLKELGYICHDVIESDRVSGPVSKHSDVLYLKIDDSTIIISSCQIRNKPLLESLGYKVIIFNELKPGYKSESFLNFIINEKYIICNPKTAIEINSDKKRINVKQGYTKCSTICVNENAYITEDEGIYKTLTGYGLDCLKIEKGNVSLKGYNYGFIGGASVKLNNKEILFFGDIEKSDDKQSLIEFLKKYNMKAEFIENKKLNDIGSALII